MKRPRILVIGSQGQVGWELRRTLAPVGQVTAVDYPAIDLTRADSIRQWIDDTAPDVVINAAAHTAVDKAESEPDLAFAINATAPGILAEILHARGGCLVHYSTDYVYAGDLDRPYVETDPTSPQNAYGRSKLAGDEAIRSVGGRHLIFRLCWVYGTRGQNFLLTMQRLGRERESLRVVGDQFGCPTWCRAIAEGTTLALCQALASPDPARFDGVYHLAAANHTSWHGFAQAIIERLPEETRKCRTVESIPSSAYPTPARRPAWSVLDTGKLEATFGLRLPAWEDMLSLALDTP
jgi:dTDP-4-dehydrorhamnose reductase